MIFFYKNKGILIPLYFFVSLIVVAISSNLLKTYAGGIFEVEYDISFLIGISLILAGIWSYLTYDSYYTVNGIKKPMHEDNTFFFIHMKIWAHIFTGVGIACTIGGLLTMMKIID